MFDIDLQSRTPIYEQLYKKVTELIVDGTLNANDKLPSVRELAKELGINPNTVSKAFQMLERDKIIYSLAGRGSFISNADASLVKAKASIDFENAVTEAKRAGLKKDELINRVEVAFSETEKKL